MVAMMLAITVVYCIRRAQRRHDAIAKVDRVAWLMSRAPDCPGWLIDRIGRDRAFAVFGSRHDIIHTTHADHKVLKEVAIIGDVQILDLAASRRLRDADLAHLLELKCLTTLSLVGTAITDHGLAFVSKVNNLKHLRLTGTRITDAGLARIGMLNQLERLDLKRTSISGVGLTYLKGLSHLSTLFLDGTPMTREGVSRLSELSQLSSLSISETDISDSELDIIKRLTNLRRLNISKTDVTGAGVGTLEMALPKCEIQTSKEE